MPKKSVFSLFILFILSSTLVSLSLLLMSCGESSHSYGSGFIDKKERPKQVGLLILSGEKYIGQVVKVKGELTAVCKQKGCYFSLIDPKGSYFSGSKVYVDLENGKKFTIPIDSEGKIGVVEGTLSFEMDITKRGWKIVADAVEIYDK